MYKFLKVDIKAKIEYEVRKNSGEFLNSIVEKVNDNKSKSNNENCIDYDYFLKCYNSIKDYIEKDGENKREEEIANGLKEDIKNYLSRIDYYVYFIKNGENVTEEYEIETFKRINKNKIKMLDAELVKSLFIEMSHEQKIEDDKYDVAFEWDRIENKLQNNDFWYFICPNDNMAQNKKIMDLNCRIQFILEVLRRYKENEKDKNTDKNKKSEKLDNKENRLFDFYEKHKNDINYLLELWKEVLKCFATLEDWYNDFILYHYLGFIFNITDNLEKCIETVCKNYQSFRKEESREEFILDLQDKIGKEIFKDIEKYKGSNGKFEWKDLKEVSVGDDNKGDIADFKKLLLLFNIQYMINRWKSFRDNEKYGKELFERFSFYHYKKDKWDIEHISPNDIGELKDDKNRMEELLKDIIINHNIYKTNNDDIENIMKYYNQKNIIKKNKINLINQLKKYFKLYMI